MPRQRWSRTTADLARGETLLPERRHHQADRRPAAGRLSIGAGQGRRRCRPRWRSRGRRSVGRRRNCGAAGRRRGLARRPRDGRMAARATQRHRAGGRARGRRSGPRGRNRWRPARRWCRCCRPAISSCASSFRKRRSRRCICGDPVAFACDGCPADLPGTISFISPQAEYTPPLIYSEVEQGQARSSCVEARPPPRPGGPAQSGRADRSAPRRDADAP